MMFTEYLNCRCIAVVGFGTSTIDGGAAPRNVHGILIAETEDYIVVNVTHSTCDSSLGSTQKLNGLTYINKKYLIAINFQ